MVKVAILLVDPLLAEMFAVAVELTLEVFIVKVADGLPAATTTDVGTVAWVELLDNVTVNPPAGADPVNVTLPVEDEPPVTVAGLRVIDRSVGGLMVKRCKSS